MYVRMLIIEYHAFGMRNNKVLYSDTVVAHNHVLSNTIYVLK